MWKKNIHTRVKDKTKELDLFGKGLGFKFSNTTMPGGVLSIVVWCIWAFFVFNLVHKMTFYQADQLNSVKELVDQSRNVTFKQARIKIFAAVTYKKKPLDFSTHFFRRNAWFYASTVD